MKVTIINAYGHSNRGDSVLLQECIEEIKAKLNAEDMHVLLFDDSEFNETEGISCSERLGNPPRGSHPIAKLSKLFFVVVCLLTALLKAPSLSRLLPASQRISLKKILEADLVVSAPGGYIHDTNTAYFIALLHIFLSTRFNKKVVLAPQSIGPVNSWFGRKITKYVLNSCDKICAREGFTLEFLSSLGVDPLIVKESGDSAFWNHQVSNNNLQEDLASLGIQSDESFVGMTMVNWTFPNQTNTLMLRNLYIETMSFLIDEIHRSFGLRTVVFNQVSDDIIITNELKLKLRTTEALVVDQLDKRPERLRALISRSEVFIGTRFHSCIFALMANVPTNAISYLPKTEYILKDLGLDERYMDISKLDKNLLFDRVKQDLLNKSEVTKQITNAVDVYRAKRKRLYDVL